MGAVLYADLVMVSSRYLGDDCPIQEYWEANEAGPSIRAAKFAYQNMPGIHGDILK
ncbi:MAG TPA: hypothetical protein VMT12_17410 [Syntrophales bacterium]|nr:hypothetical protein [Syntrophales bacterium]